jgi:hypothetical protein
MEGRRHHQLQVTGQIEATRSAMSVFAPCGKCGPWWSSALTGRIRRAS